MVSGEAGRGEALGWLELLEADDVDLFFLVSFFFAFLVRERPRSFSSFLLFIFFDFDSSVFGILAPG